MLLFLLVVDEAFHYFIERSTLRIILLNGLTLNDVEGLKKLRPIPDAYAIIADTASIEKLFKKVNCFFLGADLFGLKI